MAEIDNLVEQLGKLTVVEAGELAKKLEKAWGLNYEEILGAGGSGVPVASQEEVKDTATVTLTGFADGQKIPIIKAVRPILDLGLLEAKNFVEDLPKVIKEDKETQPPRRYTPASILKEMDKLNIGTKATRASILDALYLRNYVTDVSITATELGMQAVEALEKFCPEILDTDLTRHFEEEMEQIMEDKKTKEEVLEEAKKTLTKTLNHFREHEQEIGEVLVKATRKTEYKLNTIAECPKCKKGVIQIRNGRFGKFVACDQYPDCKNTYSLPANSLIRTHNKTCKECEFHTVLAIRSGKRPFDYCLNQECPPKVEWRKEQEKKRAEKGLPPYKRTKKKTTKKASKKK